MELFNWKSTDVLDSLSYQLQMKKKLHQTGKKKNIFDFQEALLCGDHTERSVIVAFVEHTAQSLPTNEEASIHFVLSS